MQKNNRNNHNKNVPSEKENSVSKIIESGFLSMSSHSLNPLANLSEDNINKILENDDKHDERKFKNKKEKRIFVIILSIFFGLLILSIIFKDNTELLKIILPSIISLSVGVLGGYGYGYKMEEILTIKYGKRIW